MKKIFFVSFLTFFSLFLSVTTLEVLFRLKQKNFAFENFIEKEWNFLSAGFPVSHDPELGWVTKSNFTIEKDAYQKRVTLLDNGVRSNGMENPQASEAPILVVGASHAFGTETADDETWESYLERDLHRRVVNGAVFGYGIDQMVLRFERMAPLVKPGIGILAFHPENIFQCEMSQKYAKKPYFEIEKGELVLKNTPVPETKRELSLWQKSLGYSLVAHTLGSKLLPSLWKDSRGDIRVHSQGQEVACKLVERFAKFCRAHSIRPLVVVHHWQDPAKQFVDASQALIQCAKSKEVVEVLDLREPFETTKREDPKFYASLFQFHMTPNGNKYVASAIRKLIEQN